MRIEDQYPQTTFRNVVFYEDKKVCSAMICTALKITARSVWRPTIYLWKHHEWQYFSAITRRKTNRGQYHIYFWNPTPAVSGEVYGDDPEMLFQLALANAKVMKDY